MCVQVRGRGLLNAIVVDPEAKVEAWDICMRLMREGLLTKPTHRCAALLRWGPCWQAGGVCVCE